MGMRVIAGIYRHRLLDYPADNPNIRPTKDRIREAFFSSLGDINGKMFLDLCAGCGSMGIEAISRGAKHASFVDKNELSLKFIKQNVDNLKISNYSILKMDVLEALEHFKNSGEKFDIVYFDPPYNSGIYEDVLSYIYNNDIVAENGILAFETNVKINIDFMSNLKIKEYHYGEITVVVVRK